MLATRARHACAGSPTSHRPYQSHVPPHQQTSRPGEPAPLSACGARDPARRRCLSGAARSARCGAGSEFGQLGARQHDPHTARTEIHGQGGVRLDADDPAEAVGIVDHLIPHGELLGRRSRGRRAEGTGGQEAPGRSAGWLHHYQYDPRGAARPAGLARLPENAPRRNRAPHPRKAGTPETTRSPGRHR